MAEFQHPDVPGKLPQNNLAVVNPRASIQALVTKQRMYSVPEKKLFLPQQQEFSRIFFFLTAFQHHLKTIMQK